MKARNNARILPALITLVSTVFVLMSLREAFAEKSKRSIKVTPVPHTKPGNIADRAIGHWYMGTMTGFDCDLRIKADHTLTVQYGGCFHQDPPVASEWKLSDNRIVLSNATLQKRLGSYLSIVQVGKNTVLVPEANAATVKRVGYHRETKADN